MFIKYKDPADSSKITSDGVVRFLDDLRLSPESKLVLIIAWKFRAETQCEFTKDEFINGFVGLGVDSIDKLKAKLPQLETELRDSNKFKDFYQFTFNYAKEHAQKGIDLDMAIAYWNIVLQGQFKFLDLWCKFLTVSHFRSLLLLILHHIYLIDSIAFTGKSQTIHPERYLESAIGFRIAHR